MSDFMNTVDVIGDEALTNSFIDRSITEIKDDLITNIGKSAFQDCTSLTSVDFSAVTSIGGYAFQDCASLTSVDFPVVGAVDIFAFYGCKKLTTVNFPVAGTFGSSAFQDCASLTSVNFPVATSIGYSTFSGCSKLTAVILRSETMVTLLNTGAFNSTPIKSGTGYIYVPRALLSDDDETKDYRRATNWSKFANQFRALEDYTVDGTITGELDSTKI